MQVREMTRCGLFAALLAVCGWISINMGDVALSLQTFGLFLTLGVLGGGPGSMACGVYILLGAVGVPVFTGFRGGLSVLLGPTGGYLWGFLLGALVYRWTEKHLPLWLGLVLTLLTCYACGTAWYVFAFAPEGFWLVLSRCVLPYLLPDAVKLALALPLIPKLRQAVR